MSLHNSGYTNKLVLIGIFPAANYKHDIKRLEVDSIELKDRIIRHALGCKYYGNC
jgi:hypothetical protein